jgi:hypothetical protein
MRGEGAEKQNAKTKPKKLIVSMGGASERGEK